MSARSATETIVGLYQAFLERRTWSQAELARRLGITVSSARKRLHELWDAGVPFTREEDHPHVYWSVPPTWIPGAVALSPEEMSLLLRLVARAPRSVTREAIIRRLTTSMRSPEPQQPCAVETAEVSVDEERVLHVLEDAANKQRVARINYWSASSPAGVPRWRYVSVQRLFASVPVRFVAICHEADKLKWYRADRVSAAHLDGESTFRQSAASELDEFVAASVDGFRGPGAPADCVFFVRDPEARWAVQNLPGAMQTSVIPGGVRVRTVTSAVIRLARFVVGLGDAARAETPELAAAVRELAEGALRAGARPGKLSARPAASA